MGTRMNRGIYLLHVFSTVLKRLADMVHAN